jgi:ferredoxin
MRKIRLTSQTAFLLLFLLLFFQTEYPLSPSIPYDLFCRLSPLLGLSSTISAREIIEGFWPCLITVGFTLILGRVFCGWVCPLGTLIDIRERFFLKLRYRRLNWWLLISLLILSIFSVQITGIFDPLSLLLRSLSFLYIEHLLLADVVASALFILILSLGRYWCIALCPLGDLLKLIPSLLKRETKDCEPCKLCNRKCRMQGECIRCLDCLSFCPENAVVFRLSLQKPSFNIRKREFIGSMGGALVLFLLFRISKRDNPRLIRPPGAPSEDEFLDQCIRCGECIKVCLTGGLQPALLEAGFEGIWTPRLVPRIGYCEYDCTLCGKVCPTQAIRELSKREKHRVRIGIARINKKECIPYTQNKNCLVCEEFCPVPEKAIRFKKRGNLLLPYVIEDLCIGCSVCEARCPLDKPAIIVFSIKALPG